MIFFRFLANEYGLAGADNLARAEADEAVDCMGDLFAAAVPIIVAAAEDRPPLVAKFTGETVPKIFALLEKRLAGRGGQFLAGNALSWADLNLFHMVNTIKELGVASIKEYPLCDNLCQRVGNVPNIKHWMENRPQ